MDKLFHGLIKISEISYEKNGLWCCEIKIQFNIMEKCLSKNWIKILTILQIVFVDDNFLCDVHIIVDLISLKDEKIKSIVESTLKPLFYNYSLNFSDQYTEKIKKTNGKMLISCLESHEPLVGIFVYAKDIKNIHKNSIRKTFCYNATTRNISIETKYIFYTNSIEKI